MKKTKKAKKKGRMMWISDAIFASASSFNPVKKTQSEATSDPYRPQPRIILCTTLRPHFTAILPFSQEYFSWTLSMDSFSPLDGFIPARRILMILRLLFCFSSAPW